MLVPKMTLEEIRHEIDKELPIVLRKMEYVGKKAKRLRHLNRDEIYRLNFDYLSKHKNKWLCRIDITKKMFHYQATAWYESARGVAGIGMLYESGYLMYFTSHFLKRYNDRGKLRIVLPRDILLNILNGNDRYVFKKLEEISENVFSIFCVIPCGIILGTEHRDLKFYEMKTFLSSDMLRGSQTELEQILRLQLAGHLFSKESWY